MIEQLLLPIGYALTVCYLVYLEYCLWQNKIKLESVQEMILAMAYELKKLGSPNVQIEEAPF